jgi:hypothetical protein
MNPVWPTQLEEQLLLACFAPEQAAGLALRRCSRDWTGSGIDPATRLLLPLVYRRWQTVDNQVVESGRQVYLATWNRNREHMARLAEIADLFREAGIRWLALKGVALALRHYADFGLRAMSDVDILIEAKDLGRAAVLLKQAGYRADEDATIEAIERQARVRHAWQFFGELDRNFDLHWRPVNRCYSPDVTKSFWEEAEAVRFGDREILVPSPSHQLFHVCVHGLQWDWTRKIRWIADALSVLGEPVNWERVCALAAWSSMNFRLAEALRLLRDRFQAPIPPDLPERLSRAAPAWESREFRLLLKPCPLGVYGSLAWHAYHFQRVRPFDDSWRRTPLAMALAQYFAAFLDAPRLGSLCRKLHPHLMSRLARVTRRAPGDNCAR